MSPLHYGYKQCMASPEPQRPAQDEAAGGTLPAAPAAMPVHVRRAGHRAIILRVLLLLAALVGFYYLWPQLLQFFDAVPSLERISSLWFLLMLALEVLSFVCYWGLLRITTGERRWSTIAMIQMSSTAFSRVVPGGFASGGAVNYQMFATVGIPRGRAATGVTAATLVSTGVLFMLPVLALPAMLAGAPISASLWHGLEFGLVVAALIVAGGATALFTDAPIRWAGRAIQRAIDRRRTTTAPQVDLATRLIEERNLIRTALGRRWWQALLLASGGWLFDYAALLAALAAVGAQVHPSLVLLGYVVAALLAVLPFTPGGLGFVEVGLAATLGLAGVGAAEATLAVLAYRLVSFWLPIPAGIGSYLLFRQRHRARKTSPTDRAH